MVRFLLYLIDCATLIASMLMGVFGAAGLCAAVWGPSILSTALGDVPQRGHPAFILFMVVMVPAMLIGASGALVAVIVPLHMWCRVPFLKTERGWLKFLRAYAARVVAFTASNA